jgi:curved DNA-binding protein
MFGDLFGRGRRASRKGQDIRSEVTIDLRSAIQGTVVELARPGAEPTKVRLPPGAIEGTTLRIAGQGAPGRNGGEPGDLLLVVHVGPHPHFRLEGADLHLDVPISIAEAYLGAKVKVPTVDGAVTVKVPERTQSGTVLRVRGKGVPRKGKDAGDLYVHFMVHVPREAHPDLKALMERLASFQATDLREGIAF